MASDNKRPALALLLCLGFAQLVGGRSPQPQSATIVFRHVNVIDGLSDSPSLDTTVVVTDGTITRVDKNPGDLAGKVATFDMQGKWLMPGYVDAHVHFSDIERARTPHVTERMPLLPSGRVGSW